MAMATKDRLYSGDRIGNYRVEIELSCGATASVSGTSCRDAQ
jgi:hypothetical protein